MPNGKPSFKFAAHAKGFTGHFHKVDDTDGLDYPVDSQTDSVLPETGDRCERGLPAMPFYYDVHVPSSRRLITINGLKTCAEGRDLGDRFETEVSVNITGLHVGERLRIDSVQLHMLSSHAMGDPTDPPQPVLSSKGNFIKGMWLDKVEAEVTIDEAL